MSNFAKGPWTLGKRGKSAVHIDANNDLPPWTALAKVYVKTGDIENGYKSDPVGEANARLIAKAPEMYALLKKLVALDSTPPDICADIYALSHNIERG
jgi:hypothetical protein